MSRCCRTLYESLLEGIRRGSPQTARTSRALRLPCNKSADIGKVADNRLASLPAKPCKILHLASSGRFLTNRETLCRDLSLYPRDMARVFQYLQALQVCYWIFPVAGCCRASSSKSSNSAWTAASNANGCCPVDTIIDIMIGEASWQHLVMISTACIELL